MYRAGKTDFLNKKFKISVRSVKIDTVWSLRRNRFVGVWVFFNSLEQSEKPS